MIVTKSIGACFKVKRQDADIEFHISLEEGVINTYNINRNGDIDWKHAKNSEPIREYNGKLMVWCRDNNCWLSTKDDIQNAYFDYKADDTLLGGDDESNTDGNDKEEHSS